MKKLKLLPLLLIAATTVLIPACKKKSNDPTPTPTPVTTGGPSITSSFYFQAKIDGNWITFQDGVSGYASGTGSSGGSIPSAWQEEQDALIINYSLGQGATLFILKTFPSSPLGADVEAM